MNIPMKKLLRAAKSVRGSFALGGDGFAAGDVGAALLTAGGKIYTGICIDLACGIGFCAEHSAMAEMLKSRETRIKMIVAVGKTGILPPCGRCREMMLQLDAANADAEVVLTQDRTVKLKELLPHYWNEQR